MNEQAVSSSSSPVTPGGDGEVPPPASRQVRSGVRWESLRRKLAPFAVPIALAVLVVIFQSKNSQFLTVDNIKVIVQSAAMPAIVAAGLTVVLTLGEFDLSIQAMAGFATMTFAVLMANNGVPLVPAIAIVLLIGIVVGILNGVLVAYAKLAALVVTIGMGSLLNGGEFAVTHNQSISTGISVGFTSFTRSYVGPVPTLAVIALGVGLVIWILLDRTALGREMRAIGTNSQAARFAGVNVRLVVVLGFMITALAATVAGILFTGFQGNVYPLSGLSVLLQSFAACFIGATMFRVGEFNVPGSIVGALLASVVSNGLLLANVANYGTYFFQGGILIVAVLFARVLAGKSEEL